MIGLQGCKENGCWRFVVGGATDVLGSALDAWTRFENNMEFIVYHDVCTWRVGANQDRRRSHTRETN